LGGSYGITPSILPLAGVLLVVGALETGSETTGVTVTANGAGNGIVGAGSITAGKTLLG